MYFFYHRLLDVLAKFSCSWIIVGFNTNWQLHHLGNIFLITILNIFGGSISHGLSTFNYYFIHEKVHKSIWIKRGTGTYIQYMYYLQCQNTGLQSGNREVFFFLTVKSVFLSHSEYKRVNWQFSHTCTLPVLFVLTLQHTFHPPMWHGPIQSLCPLGRCTCKTVAQREWKISLLELRYW